VSGNQLTRGLDAKPSGDDLDGGAPERGKPPEREP